jgi:alcohol dehydrogenase class IV
MYPQIELELRKFIAPEFVFGLGARHMAGRYAKNFGVRKVLVVTDPGVIAAGWAGDIMSSLEAAGINYTVFAEVSPNPRAEEVMDGAQTYQREGCNAIVAIGGGSPIDCAKGIGIVSSNNRHIIGFEGVDKVDIPGPPLICIPTTAGSSADVSQFAIITDSMRQLKMAIVSKMLVPDVALIDPQTLVTMPSYLTACTGMDAVTHAIEAFVSNANSPVTDMHALEAIRLISVNLLPAIKEPENLEHRGKMMLGSMLAGLAFSNAILGAVHAMAHSLGGLLDLPHGECNAILLKHVIAYNFDSAPERYFIIGEAMGLNLHGLPLEKKKAAILDEISHLQKTVGIARTLGQLGVQRSNIPELARNAIKDACMATNPRKAMQKEIEVVYEEAL